MSNSRKPTSIAGRVFGTFAGVLGAGLVAAFAAGTPAAAQAPTLAGKTVTMVIGFGTYSYPKALNGLMGTKFKLISGFPSSTDVFLAMERNEVDGICESLDSVIAKRPDWIATKKVNVLFHGGAEPNATLKGIPFVVDLARNAGEKQAIEFLYAGQGIGRPFVAPPDLPADRVKMLRDAFNATMKDADFAADVTRQKLDLEPEDGEHLGALIKKIYATPKALVGKISELIK